MTSVPEYIRASLDKARMLEEEYRRYILNGDCTKKSIDDLLEVCKQYLGKPITLHEIKIQNDGPTRAAFLAYADHFEIYLRHTDDEKWKRFYLCKELFHCILDEIECHELDLYKHLEEFLSPSIVKVAGNNVVWEYLAMAAAAEFLLPYTDRVAIVATANIDYQAISARYGIPLLVVEAYLAESSMNFFKTYRGGD